jgi:hypothetical protein
MKQFLDTVWQRRGTSWIWDAEALTQVCQAQEVWSLRQFLRSVGKWSENLPSNQGQTLVVAGLEGCLDLLSPDEAEKWLAEDIKQAVLSFQDFWVGQAALVFWLPSGAGRITVNPATDEVYWRCAAPHTSSKIDFGRILWGGAHEYPKEIILREGAKAVGLFHLRIT